MLNIHVRLPSDSCATEKPKHKTPLKFDNDCESVVIVWLHNFSEEFDYHAATRLFEGSSCKRNGKM